MHAALEYLSILLIALLAMYHHRRLKHLAKYDGSMTNAASRKQHLLFVLYALAMSTTGVLLLISCMNNFVSYLSEVIALGCILMDLSITLIYRRRIMRLQTAPRSFSNAKHEIVEDETSEHRFSRYRIMTSWLALIYMAVAVITTARICIA